MRTTAAKYYLSKIKNNCMKRLYTTILSLTLFTALWAQGYDLLFETGTQHLRSGQYQQAISTLQQAIALEPDNKLNEYAYSNLAYAQWNRGYSNDAIVSYTHALGFNPQSTAILLQRARVYMESEKPDSALADYSRTLDIDPRNTHALFMRAYIYGSRQEYTKAYADYNRLLSIEPGNDQARLSLALLYHKAGRLNESLMLVGMLIDSSPDNAEYYYARSNIESAEGQTELALMDIERAIELAPGTAEYQVALARLQMKRDRKAEARKALDKAASLGYDIEELMPLYQEIGIQKKRVSI